jgi:peptidoglycan hydrolase-like protein with peptidoglycan-binding domain
VQSSPRRSRARQGAVVLAAVAALGVPSAAQAHVRTLHRGMSGPKVEALQRGLHITADGIYGRATVRAVRRFQRHHGLTPDGVAGPATRRALWARTLRQRRRLQGTSASQVLARIADCESGGNPTAVSPDGRYRGKYQFTRATWHALGGTGDPAKASESEQDHLARILYRREGTKPWPVCGRQAT